MEKIYSLATIPCQSSWNCWMSDWFGDDVSNCVFVRQGKSYVEWTPQEVSEFVLSLGVGTRYAEVGQQLFEAGVNGEFFITLKDDDLKDLGVSLGFDRKRIIYAIDKLINPEEPPDSLSPRRSRSRPSRSPNNIEPNNPSPRASEQPSVHRLSRREVYCSVFQKFHVYFSQRFKIQSILSLSHVSKKYMCIPLVLALVWVLAKWKFILWFCRMMKTELSKHFIFPARNIKSKSSAFEALDSS